MAIALSAFRREMLVVAGALAVAACAPAPEPQPVAMAQLHDMPPEVQAAPLAVQDAYRFASANPCMAAIPIRSPVNEPGPTVRAIPAISTRERPVSDRTDSINGMRISA